MYNGGTHDRTENNVKYAKNWSMNEQSLKSQNKKNSYAHTHTHSRIYLKYWMMLYSLFMYFNDLLIYFFSTTRQSLPYLLIFWKRKKSYYYIPTSWHFYEAFKIVMPWTFFTSDGSSFNTNCIMLRS